MRKDNYKKVNLKVNQWLINKLIYLSYSTKPNISFVVKQLSKQNADSKARYFKVAKQVVWYLKSRIHLRLIYKIYPLSRKKTKASAKPLSFVLVGYTDSNYAGNPKDKKSVMWYCFFIYKVLVLWCSKKQYIVFTFTTKTKYIVLEHAAHENMWIHQFLNELRIANSIRAYMFYSNNKTSIIFTKNAKS